MKNKNIYIIEDDPVYATFLEYQIDLLNSWNINSYKTNTTIDQILATNPDCVTLDLSIEHINAQELLNQIHQKKLNCSVLIISGQDNITSAIDLIKLGAYDYITKDEYTVDRLRANLRNITKQIELNKEIESHQRKSTALIIGNCPKIKQTNELIAKAAKSNINVSIQGETGTGKELVAKSIYELMQVTGKFVAVNIASLPENLIESELFGHEKGAFTGANNMRIGKFEEAHNGVLFLDEIAELDTQIQVKLLRVLQEKEITRIGSNKTIKYDCKIIIATHKNLLEEVKEGRFREDLYYRLQGFPINLPSLRERGNDIILLSNHFVKLFCQENKIPSKKLSPKSIAKLLSYSFPGNIRELKSIIDLAVAMNEEEIIDESNIIFNPIHKNNFLLNEEKTLKEYELDIIENFLNKYNHDVAKVSEILDIPKSSLYKIIKTNNL